MRRKPAFSLSTAIMPVGAALGTRSASGIIGTLPPDWGFADAFAFALAFDPELEDPEPSRQHHGCASIGGDATTTKGWNC